MLIKFYKIKHFWENNENATWEKSSDFDKNIFEEIKQDYIYLGSKKPKYKIINKKHVFFYYEEKKDKYERKIIELVAFIPSKNIITNPDKVYNNIKSQTSIFNSQLNVAIEIDEKINKYKIIYLIPVICIFLFVIYIMSKDADKKDVKPISKEEVISQDYRTFKSKWNESIEEKKIEKKYLLENSNSDYIYSQLTTYLNLQKHTEELNKINDLNMVYGTLVKSWIKFRNEIKFSELNRNVTENELYSQIAKIVNEDYFSTKVVLKIIELNDFCFYYEKHKEEFFKQGLSKDTTCKNIEKGLSEYKIFLK